MKTSSKGRIATQKQTVKKPKGYTPKGVTPKTYTSAKKTSAKNYFSVVKDLKNVDAEKNEVKVSTAWGSFSLPAKEITGWQSSLPLLPFEMFLSISGYLQWCALTHDSEGRVDLTIIDGKWVMECFYQKAAGSADVTVDFETQENEALLTPELAAAFKNIHCTFHSHTDFSAFQSGTDEDDEMDKNGWHITLGTYGSGKVDNHARYTVRESAKFNDQGDKVAPALNFFFEVGIEDIVAKPALEELDFKTEMISDEVFNLTSSYPAEWESRFHKKKYTQLWPSQHSRAWGGYADVTYSDEELEEANAYYLQNSSRGKQQSVPLEVVEDESYSDYEESCIEAFELETKISFDELDFYLEGMESPTEKAEEIYAWMADRVLSNDSNLPSEQTITAMLTFYNGEDQDLAIHIATEIAEKL